MVAVAFGRGRRTGHGLRQTDSSILCPAFVVHFCPGSTGMFIFMPPHFTLVLLLPPLCAGDTTLKHYVRVSFELWLGRYHSPLGQAG